MAFAIAGLLAQGETVIEGGEYAAVSFPEFFETLSRLTVQ
jgi:3-phosphoshikimate 1-carboxyvinyltransferase